MKEEEETDEGKTAGRIKAQYSGDFRFGKKHGTGKMRYPDGGVYTGAWADDQREGSGTYYYPNGDVFTGRWAGDKKQGRGSYTYAKNGSKLPVPENISPQESGFRATTLYHGSFRQQNPTGDAYPSGNVIEGKYESKAVEEEEEESNTGGGPGSGS